MSLFFASLGHELRTPLNAVLGFSDALRQEVFGGLSDKNREYADLIHQSGTQLTLLVDDVLDAARAQSGKLDVQPKDMELRGSALKAMRMLEPAAKTAGLRLRLLDGKDVWAFADERAVHQIWLNLLSNAIKFTPGGGEVTLRVEHLAEGTRLSVRDTGPGLSPEMVAELGQPFRRVETGRGKAGTGLGLSVVRTYADAMHGTMEIDSAPGEGTTLMVGLPVGSMPEDKS